MPPTETIVGSRDDPNPVQTTVRISDAELVPFPYPEKGGPKNVYEVPDNMTIEFTIFSQSLQTAVMARILFVDANEQGEAKAYWVGYMKNHQKWVMATDNPSLKIVVETA